MADNKSRPSTRRPVKRRRRRRGISLGLVIVLLIMAMLMGIMAGYVVARKTDPHVYELQAAKDRVMELENTLTLIGYPVDGDAEPGQWLYDSSAAGNAMDDLSGESWGESEDDLWDDDGLLTGTLPEDADPVVVAEFDGGELLSTEVIPKYNDALTDQIFAGHAADEVAEATLNRVMAQLVSEKIIIARAESLNLTTLDSEDLSQIEQEAQRRYELELSDYIAFVGNGADDRDTAARQLEAERGVTLASVTEEVRQSWWLRKFRNHVVADVTVSDDEIQACYSELLATQRDLYDAFPEEFENDHLNGETIVYHPEGYRAVRDILIPFASEADEEAAMRLTDQLFANPDDADARAQLDALYAPLEATAAEVQAKLNGGASFDALMDEYGTDEALEAQPLRSEGRYISSASDVNSAEYVEGAMMLEQPGQVSSPLRSVFGIHLVQYVSDVAAGEIPLSAVSDAVRALALSQKQDQYYDQQCEELLKSANVKYYPERLQ